MSNYGQNPQQTHQRQQTTYTPNPNSNVSLVKDNQAPVLQSKQVVAKGLADMFGLDIRVAVLTIIVDMMLFGAEVISAGLLIFVSIIVASVLGYIVYNIQTKWYGDDHDSAKIKALIVALLTAIPAPLSPIIAIPGGVLGLYKMIRGK